MSKLDDLTKKVAALKKPGNKPAEKAQPVTAKPTPTKKPAAEKPESTPKLSQSERREVAIETACQEYVLNGGDQSKAYRKAFPASQKWKDKTVHEKASRLFKEGKVQTRVRELQAKVAEVAKEKFSVDTEYVLRAIVETVERCRQTVRPVVNKAGEHQLTETPEGEGLAYVFDAGNALRGAELLGKHLKMFTDKVEHGGPDGGPIQIVERRIVRVGN